ncbi:TPA: tetrahydromethanopterin S-methyltransferase subunit B [Methanocaldococcus jannaschii]|uniref:Tetrahydromethanopterin S-methyltransferase subunit B n=2 Tax=Methanocaldococcus jannaschii TaxID=2190 RepID=MTRB_METJA|nr:tetrahydromethanopterin S-methyltransferase subunit B [Methanocaldococcus jannaschii]Q58260.1 RecName: Full=Tetrahydromethanopterin S-methyltransferase subunit B; AltName: Full=N5-methyltetrahydromethanopterin--coenzyme M methyltransferase subunit B [Methanocaldococcus jannaschii DSM 2661]AAB98855.1 N5-methyl-tetrahydromethanopterin:coenzyme M methyltransferase, subunit B (mrtB) [Methanocaldococcus jannaschii DSM 2661]HII59019.1 tetrahydromethanopterin S-methyltransferase subunit B [Methanoca
MATYVFIDQNIPLVYTVETGVITKGFGDLLFVDVSPIEEQIKKLETLVDAYEHSLDPRYPPLNSFPNRDGVYAISGYFKSAFFGFWIGLGIMALLAIILGVKF